MLDRTRFAAATRILLGALAFPAILAGCIGVEDPNEPLHSPGTMIASPLRIRPGLNRFAFRWWFACQ